MTKIILLLFLITVIRPKKIKATTDEYTGCDELKPSLSIADNLTRDSNENI